MGAPISAVDRLREQLGRLRKAEAEGASLARLNVIRGMITDAASDALGLGEMGGDPPGTRIIIQHPGLVRPDGEPYHSWVLREDGWYDEPDEAIMARAGGPMEEALNRVLADAKRMDGLE